MCALLQARADYAARQGPPHLSEPCRIFSAAAPAGRLGSDAQIVQFRAWLDRIARRLGLLPPTAWAAGWLASDHQEVADSEQAPLLRAHERYPKLPFLKPLTCDDAREMPGFG